MKYDPVTCWTIVIGIVALFLVIAGLARLLGKGGEKKPGPETHLHKECPSCGWKGMVSKYHKKCSNCGAQLV